MILIKILEHDFHKPRSGVDGIPAVIETPARASHIPAIVSTSRGKFVVSRRLTVSGQKFGNLVPLAGGGIVSGVFEYDPDRLDDVIGPLLESALALSESEGWTNVFRSCPPGHAFDYVQTHSGMKSQPHVCLVPEPWSDAVVGKWLQDWDVDSRRFRKTCRIVSAKVPFPAFLSRPDMVGIYTQFLGGRSSILLHNVKLGMAICPISS